MGDPVVAPGAAQSFLDMQVDPYSSENISKAIAEVATAGKGAKRAKPGTPQATPAAHKHTNKEKDKDEMDGGTRRKRKEG